RGTGDQAMIGQKSDKEAGDAVAAILDRVQSAAYLPEPADRPKRQESASSQQPVSQDRASSARFWGAVMAAGLGGTVAGAALVVAAIWYGPGLSLIPADPRIETIERRLGAAETRISGQGEDVERLAVQVASALDNGESATESLAAQ